MNACKTFSYLKKNKKKLKRHFKIAMQEELNQLERNKISKLVFKPKYRVVIGTKWVFRNKMNEAGIVTRNKVRRVDKGYSQEGIDFDDTFAPVTRLEAIRILSLYHYSTDFNIITIPTNFFTP